LLRASRGREVLAERLTAAGADVEQVVVYLSTDITQPTEEVAEALAAGRVDWITVTSSAIARALVALLGQELGKTKLAAISPLTAGVLADAGYPPNVVADVYTAEGLLAAILNAEACETN
jgi:uroporphyrinogen III methyltransferase/synthase